MKEAAKRRHSRPYFRKIDVTDTKWTRGRSFTKLPGKIVVTPTNFEEISYLNLEEYSYNYFYRHSDYGRVPKVIADDYFQCKYNRTRITGKIAEFSDLKLRHIKEAVNCITYEFDHYVLKKLRFQWDSEKFRKYLVYYRTSSQMFDFKRSSLVYTMFPPVLSKHCNDSKLIVDFFQTICSHIITCESIFMGSTVFLRMFLEHCRTIGFNPWSLLRKYQISTKSSPVKEFCPVEWSLIQGKFEHLELLLKFGCPFYVSNYSTKVFNKKLDGRWWNRNRDIPILMPGDTEPTSPLEFRKSPTFLAHLTVIIYLVANNAVCVHDPGRRFLDCINLFMRSVPYPYVSYEDMVFIMGQLAPSISSSIFDMSCKWYKTAFADANGHSGPRSLKHLSRCIIRKHCPLPYGISEIPLPAYLKTYLNLEY